MKIDYVFALMQVPDEDNRWMLEASVDRERHFVTIANVNHENEDPVLEVMDSCSEDFRNAIAAVAPRIITGFFVWRHIFNTAEEKNHYPIRIACVLECERRYREEVESRSTPQPNANISPTNPFGLELGGYST
ncbi:hypothetical protein IQ250_04545 [Pseudanabaenaceae cyanobacterium LEGE 13415]|nr:hypothetical protein [Pseudanabaenaceae cyanobacterium LEGE 13415]